MGDEARIVHRFLPDDRSRVLGVGGNRPHLDSVSDRIAGAIVRFCKAHAGLEFYADDLRCHVTAQVGSVAPGSADRVLRDLRQRGIVSYHVVNRAKSLYRCGP